MSAAHRAGRASAARPLPSAFRAAVWYAVRVCVPPRRWALLLLPCVGAVLFGLLAHTIDGVSDARALEDVSEGLFGLVLPLASLVVGDAVLGAEVRRGTFTTTWLSPVPFGVIVGARWLAGWLVASIALVPAMALAAVAAGVPEGVGAIALATLGGAAAYIAMFIVVGVTTRRAALWSLGVVLLGERLLGAVLSGIAQLSPQWLARNVYGELGPGSGDLVRSGVPAGWAAIARLALVTLVLLVIAERRVRVMRLAPGGD